jgi:hypothetical protein
MPPIRNTAKKGANFERSLLKLAMEKGATLALRGASSKSRSPIPNLKVDLVIIKGRALYLVQAKKHRRPAGPAEKDRFLTAMDNAGLEYGAKLEVEYAFIEHEAQLEELLGD